MALNVVNVRSFDLVAVRPDELQPLEEYKNKGIEYFVLRPESYANSRLRRPWVGLVDEIRRDEDIILVKRFEPVPNNMPGPTIEIYRNTAADPTNH